MINFNNKPILGMIHLSGLYHESTIARAIKEIDIFIEEGVDGCIIENYHGDIEEVEAVLVYFNEQYRSKIKIGINILPNDYKKAIELAIKYKAEFIQLDYVAGNYIATPSIDKEEYLKVVKSSNITVLGGVWPKYYTPLKTSVLENDIDEAKLLADAIVVTGTGTGKETSLDKIKEFKKLCGKTPLIIGAGLDVGNIKEQLPFADGAIVGSCFKPYKKTTEMINKELVKEFMVEVNKIRNAS